MWFKFRNVTCSDFFALDVNSFVYNHILFLSKGMLFKHENLITYLNAIYFLLSRKALTLTNVAGPRDGVSSTKDRS